MKLELRLCYWDSEVDPTGKLWLSCYRPALPGRRVCHKHAGLINRRMARRRRNSIARRTRRLAARASR